MGYVRVLPRDLFNEADLLKCYGQLWLELERRRRHKCAILQEHVSEFRIEQSEGDGSITVANLTFEVAGQPMRLYRPLNARDSFPLWVTDEADVDIRVFDEVLKGCLSEEFLALIGWSAEAPPA